MSYKDIYILGVGGSGMSSIAKYLKQKGDNVIGYDQRKSYVTNLLNQDGIKVVHTLEEIAYKPDSFYIYSSAIPIESERFKDFYDKKNVVSRPEYLQNLSENHRIIGITGTHGKTSTTALLSHIFHFNNLNVSYLYGGITTFNGIGGHYGDADQPLILETDEAFNTFEKINISDLLVLNVDNDHLDYFKNIDNYKDAFYKVMKNVTDNLVVNNDDLNIKSMKELKKSVAYGKDISADFKVQSAGIFIYKNNKYEIKSDIIGDHFKSNMLGAIILALLNGIEIKDSLNAIKSFPGVKRRIELIGRSKGVLIYDDYGHHPTEMEATITALKQQTDNKLYVVFQPHRYTRTKEYFNLFKDSLKLADYAIVTDIYPAGESSIPGVSSKNFEEESIKYLKSIRYVPEYLSKKVQNGDIILTLGAGDITLLGPKILKYLNDY